MLLLNLTRDQLHRHHEVARLAQLWRTALAGVDHVVANADDVLAAVRLLPPGDVQVLANYTAFQDARRSLARAR